MSTLTAELVQQKLLEKDEMKKVAYKKQQLSKHRKSKEIKDIKDPSTKLTKITQIVTPKEEGAKEDKGKPVIPQADFAHTYTDKMPHGQAPGTGGSGKNQKSPKGKKVTSMKPNQKTVLKQVKGAIKGTEAGSGDKKAMTPGDADFAYNYTDKMPHGSKTLGTAKGESGEGLAKPSVAKMAGGPTRAGGERKAKSLGEVPGGDKKKTTQINHAGNEMPQPKDAMKWRQGKYQTNKQGHNVVESGVALRLKGKTKAVFEIVSQKVLGRMIENYRKHGYQLVAERVEPKWKSDKHLMSLLRETMHAKHNFVPSVHKILRKAALQRFGSLVNESHNDLYEDRKDFVQTVLSAFSQIEETAEKKYLGGLEIFECTARVKVEKDVEADLEIVTEATDHRMALRQISNQIKEEFGLDANIEHIFIDGDKYGVKDVRDYKIRNRVALETYAKMFERYSRK